VASAGGADEAASPGPADPERPGAPLRFVVDEDASGQRIDHILAVLAGISRAQAKRWIEAGRVNIAGRDVTRASVKVRDGDLLEASPPEPVEAGVRAEPLAIRVEYEDAELIVVDKAAGMVVHPSPGHATGTLVNALLHHCGDLAGVGGVLRPGIVHRLDRGTSGIMVAAKTDSAHNHLASQFHDHTIERIYWAFVRGLPTASAGRVDRPIGRHPSDRKRMSVRSRSSRVAATAWRVLERFPASNLTHLEIRPETGRTHQIRVHLSSAGLPLIGDPVYGRARRRVSPGLSPLERPALHAAVLGFTHPATGERLSFSAPLPDDLILLQQELRSREE
jgi:23S rRNA pseudouridine1911/1915/1917 synthase